MNRRRGFPRRPRAPRGSCPPGPSRRRTRPAPSHAGTPRTCTRTRRDPPPVEGACSPRRRTAGPGRARGPAAASGPAARRVGRAGAARGPSESARPPPPAGAPGTRPGAAAPPRRPLRRAWPRGSGRRGSRVSRVWSRLRLRLGSRGLAGRRRRRLEPAEPSSAHGPAPGPGCVSTISRYARLAPPCRRRLERGGQPARPSKYRLDTGGDSTTRRGRPARPRGSDAVAARSARRRGAHRALLALEVGDGLGDLERRLPLLSRRGVGPSQPRWTGQGVLGEVAPQRGPGRLRVGRPVQPERDSPIW